MELRRPFGVDERLSPSTARGIFDRCNQRLQDDGFTCLGMLRGFRVAVVCTTDDPADDLRHHRRLAERPDPDTRVYPTWRPDRAFAVEDPAAFGAYLARLEQASGKTVGGRFSSLLEALAARHDAFHAMGCRASDHGLETLYVEPATAAELDAAFDALRAGRAPGAAEALKLKSALLYEFALLDHARGWTQQFHLGALRNTNTRMRRTLGPDTGFDSIGDVEIARPLARFLDRLDDTNQLAKTILYNLNPRDNALLATMIGNFQDGSVPGKMQYGSAWWFLDQNDGMTDQMAALSNMGLLCALRRHGHRLAQLPVLLAPRVLPPAPVQPRRRGRPARTPARRPRTPRSSGFQRLLLQRARLFRVPAREGGGGRSTRGLKPPGSIYAEVEALASTHQPRRWRSVRRFPARRSANRWRPVPA